MKSLFLGVALVSVPMGAASQVEAHLEKLWELGSADGPEHAVWQQISDVVVSGDHLYVLDNGLQTLRQFTVSGAYARDLGGRGQGPGEFSGPGVIGAVPGGVELFDVFSRRRIEFDSEGRSVATEVLREYPGPLAPGIGVRLRHGWVLSPLPTYGNQYEDYVTLHAIWRGEESDTIAIQRSLMTMTELQPGLRRPLPPNTGPDQAVVALGDSVVVVVDGNGSVATGYRPLEFGVEATGRWTLPGSARALDQDEEQLLLEIVEERGRSPDGSVLPDRWPAWVDVEDGGDGVLWVKQGGGQNLSGMGPAERWLRWRVGSNDFTWVEAPIGVRLLGMRGELVAGVRTDDLDVPYLVAFRLVER